MKKLKDMPVYPMRTVVKLTGVGPHKLRFWESRYKLISPSRTRSGHRLYSKQDIEKIKMVADLVENQGFSLIAVREMLSGDNELANSELDADAEE